MDVVYPFCLWWIVWIYLLSSNGFSIILSNSGKLMLDNLDLLFLGEMFCGMLFHAVLWM